MRSVARLPGGVLALVHAAVRGVLRAHVRAHHVAQLVPAAHAVRVLGSRDLGFSLRAHVRAHHVAQLVPAAHAVRVSGTRGLGFRLQGPQSIACRAAGRGKC